MPNTVILQRDADSDELAKYVPQELRVGQWRAFHDEVEQR